MAHEHRRTEWQPEGHDKRESAVCPVASEEILEAQVHHLQHLPRSQAARGKETYDRLKAADVVILAGTVRDRYLSSWWKLFFDRGFYMNHLPIFGDKQVVWLVSGPLAQLANLRQILEGYMACQRANLVGIVTDECADSPRLDRLLDCLAARLAGSAAAGYVAPDTFLGVAGRKIFRDEIWANLRMVFQADHCYYRSRGLYDFPRRSL